jgi:transcriptional regulator with XRE-family HTH domain
LAKATTAKRSKPAERKRGIPRSPVLIQSSAAREPELQEDMQIGARLKHARLTRGLTLRQLADLVACSESMISKVENEKLRPSLAMLHRLASALGTSMAALFSDEDDKLGPVRIFPSEKRHRVEVDPRPGSKGMWFERIIPTGRNGLLQANILNIPPGSRSDGFVEHTGEDFGYVIEGEVEIIVGGVSYPVKAGDAFFFPSSLPHGHRNTGKRFARVLWVNTPPTL